MEWVFLQNGVQVIFMNLDIYIYINNFDIYKKKSNCEIVYVPFEIIGMAYFRLEYLIWLGWRNIVILLLQQSQTLLILIHNPCIYPWVIFQCRMQNMKRNYRIKYLFQKVFLRL